MSCWRCASGVSLVESFTVRYLWCKHERTDDLHRRTRRCLRCPQGCIVRISCSGNSNDHHTDLTDAVCWWNLARPSCFFILSVLKLSSVILGCSVDSVLQKGSWMSCLCRSIYFGSYLLVITLNLKSVICVSVISVLISGDKNRYM